MMRLMRSWPAVWKRLLQSSVQTGHTTPAKLWVRYGSLPALDSAVALDFELCFIALHLWQSSLSVLTLLRCADKPVHLHESSIKSWLPEAYFLRAAEGAAAPVQPSRPLC